MSTVKLSERIKEFYIDLEITTHYLSLLNHIYIALSNHGFKELLEKLPSSDLIIKLITNITSVRFKLLREIIDGIKIDKSSKLKKFTFDPNADYEIDDLIVRFIALTEGYAVSEKIKNKSEFLEFMNNLAESSMIVCIIELIGKQFSEIIDAVESNVELYNQINDEIEDCVNMIYMIKYKFETDVLNNKFE